MLVYVKPYVDPPHTHPSASSIPYLENNVVDEPDTSHLDGQAHDGAFPRHHFLQRLHVLLAVYRNVLYLGDKRFGREGRLHSVDDFRGWNGGVGVNWEGWVR